MLGFLYATAFLPLTALAIHPLVMRDNTPADTTCRDWTCNKCKPLHSYKICCNGYTYNSDSDFFWFYNCTERAGYSCDNDHRYKVCGQRVVPVPEGSTVTIPGLDPAITPYSLCSGCTPVYNFS